MAKIFGKGYIREIIKGKKYHLELSAGKDPVTGEYRRHRETFLGTRRQAELRIEEIRRELENGKRVDADKVTVAEWIERYVSERENSGKVRPSTIKKDRQLAKHVIGGLGAYRLADVVPADITALYTDMRKAGKGQATLYQVHRFLKAAFKSAVNNDLLTRNPVERVEAPSKPKTKRRALDAAEVERLERACTDEGRTANLTAVFLGLHIGARLGEILGLTWRDVCLDDARPFVHISKQYTSKGEVAPTKTDADELEIGRIVPLDASTRTYLIEWRKEQRAQLNEIRLEQSETTPVVSNAVGGYTNHHNFERWFRAFCVRNGFGEWRDENGRRVIPAELGETVADKDAIIEWHDASGWPCDSSGKRYSRTYKRPEIKRHYSGLVFHELRHTSFTMRLAAGVDVTTCQYLGGWNSPTMLLNVYAHPVSDRVWASAEYMQKAMK